MRRMSTVKEHGGVPADGARQTDPSPVAATLRSSALIRTVKAERIIVVLRRLPPESIPDIVDVLMLAGMCIVEITLDSQAALDTIARIARHRDQRLVLAAGTVRSSDEAT